MSDTKSRTRNTIKNENNWRFNKSYNKAQWKYTRETILALYSAPAPIQLPDSIDLVFSHSPATPALPSAGPFAHTLGDDIHSRKPFIQERKFEKIPEWMGVDAPTSLNCKEEEKFTEEFNQIDLEAEEKLKNAPEEPDEAPEEPGEAPEWDDPVDTKLEFSTTPQAPREKQPALVPAYDYQLVSYHRTLGSPFAKGLLELGRPYNGLLYIYPESGAYNKCWFYKDPESTVQGPFSMLEMFNWSARGCFPPDLQVSLGPENSYIQLCSFKGMSPIEEENAYERMATTDTKKNEQATMMLKNILGLNKGLG